ncbi:hypothetical protein N657DRAFT_246989 [Parathielavia appendiculata]|uniref:Uncharacterized protein n=1 Tax=Parathielavia appendiculata TaxID=2587402 RepID=A0AAN6TT79_9PEZI|nr:hypothetical protein N657DRAFT_246989 [Parathielavia appendiculata]
MMGTCNSWIGITSSGSSSTLQAVPRCDFMERPIEPRFADYPKLLDTPASSTQTGTWSSIEWLPIFWYPVTTVRPIRGCWLSNAPPGRPPELPTSIPTQKNETTATAETSNRLYRKVGVLA